MGRPRKVQPVETGGETPEVEIRQTEEAKFDPVSLDGVKRSDMPALLAKAKATNDKPMIAALLKACSK